MAGAIIIASALGVLLLVLCGYVLVSGTLASADSSGSAQKDVAQEKDEQIHTAIQISGAEIFWDNGAHTHNISFKLKNIGSAPIGDFNRTDVFIKISNDAITVRYSFNGVVSGNVQPGDYTKRTWGNLSITPDITHPYMLDPGETMLVNIGDTSGYLDEHWKVVVNVTAPNGVTNGTAQP